MILSDLLWIVFATSEGEREPSGPYLAGCELTGREASGPHSHAKRGNENK